VADGRFGDAFVLLTDLLPADLIGILGECPPVVRQALLDHVAEVAVHLDRLRMASALRSVAWAEPTLGIAGLNLLSAARAAKPTEFGPVWAPLLSLSRVQLAATLRTLDRATLKSLAANLSQAPDQNRTRLKDVVTDLLGTGTNMQATDVIDLAGLEGLDREMARIYNFRGRIIFEQAQALGVSTHAAAGIMKVESGGATFSSVTNKTIVRFENHIFWREWGSANPDVFHEHFAFTSPGDAWKGHLYRDSAADAWSKFHGDQVKEWHVVKLAAGLSGKEPAYRSASWGAGQIMGFNARSVGFDTATDMATAFTTSERPQVAAIFEFIRSHNLQDAVRADDFLAVAKRYNGSGQAASYATIIGRNATAYRTVTAGKQDVIG
jgi:hypothetical protein